MTGPDKRFRSRHLFASIHQIGILPGLNLLAQISRLLTQLANRILKRLQKFSRSKDSLFRGYQSHVCSLTSCVSDLRTRETENGQQEGILWPLAHFF